MPRIFLFNVIASILILCVPISSATQVSWHCPSLFAKLFSRFTDRRPGLLIYDHAHPPRVNGIYKEQNSIYGEAYIEVSGRAPIPLHDRPIPTTDPVPINYRAAAQRVDPKFKSTKTAEAFLQKNLKDPRSQFGILGWDYTAIKDLPSSTLATILKKKIRGPRSTYLYHATPIESFAKIQQLGWINSKGQKVTTGSLGTTRDGFWAAADFEYVAHAYGGGHAVILRVRPDANDVGIFTQSFLQPRRLDEFEFSIDGLNWYPGSFPLDKISK